MDGTPAPPARAVSLPELMGMPRNALWEILRGDGEADLARRAAWVMGNRLTLTDEDAQVLGERLARTRDSESELRCTLLWALSLRPDRLPVNLVVEWGRIQQDPRVRKAALRALVGLVDPRATTAWTHAATRDEHPTIRREGIAFLTTRLESFEAVRLAADALRIESHPDVRAQWLNLLGVQSARAADDLLHNFLYDPNEPIAGRRMAAEMLSARSRDSAGRFAQDPLLPDAVRDAARSALAAEHERDAKTAPARDE